MKIDVKKFKKVASDKDSTTLRHADGHEMRIAHKALTPSMRAQLAALPSEKSTKAPQNLFDGGKAKPATAYVDTIDSEYAPAKKKEPTEHAGEGYTSTKNTHPTPNAPEDNSPTPKKSYKDSVAEFNAKLAPMAKGGEVKMADGGYPPEPKEVDYKSLPQDAPPAEAPAQSAAPQAPVVVNVNGGAQPSPEAAQTPMGQGAGHAIGSAIRQGVSDALGGFKTLAAPLIHGAEGVVQGVSGQPLAPISPEATQGPSPASVPNQQAPQGLAPQKQAPQAPSDPYGTQAAYDTFQEGYKNTQQGIKDQAAAEAHLGQQEAKVQAENIRNQRETKDEYQANFANLDGHRKEALHAYENQHIDPNHYWGEKSTPGKISTIVGLLLGGLGSNGNAAFDLLDKHIERDIDAQKAEMGKRQNILSYNMEHFKNLKDATDMTRIMQADIASSQFKQAAAQAATPMAAAKALQLAGNLDMQVHNELGQMTMRKTLLSAANAGKIPAERVVALALPPEARAEATKELKSARDMLKIKDNALDAYDKVSQMSLRGVFSPSQKKAFISPILAQMVKDSEGRITPQDTEMIAALFPATGDFSKETQQVKRAKLNQFLAEKMNFPTLEGYGLDVSNTGQYDQHGQPRIKFNPQR